MTSHQLPRFALAIRQPWAWAIIHGGKDMENRDWKRWMKDWKFRARVAIIASSGMTRDEYEEGAEFIEVVTRKPCPAPHELIRGAVIGHVEIADNVWESASPWFMGPGALVLRDPVACLPVPVSGKLGIFEWTAAPDRPLAQPAKWMLPKPEVML